MSSRHAEKQETAQAPLQDRFARTSRNASYRPASMPLQNQALTEIQNLEEELAAGKKAALEAIEGLKMHARDVRNSAAASFAKLEAEVSFDIMQCC